MRNTEYYLSIYLEKEILNVINLINIYTSADTLPQSGLLRH